MWQYQCVIHILSGAMFKALFVLITVGCQLLIPLVEIALNIWNILSINQMILDPHSGYGEEYFFDWLLEDPLAEISPALISECKSMATQMLMIMFDKSFFKYLDLKMI